MIRRRWAVEVLLTVVAVAGATCLAVAAAVTALGVRPLIVLSGSMAPEIPKGALVVTREVDAGDVRIGDIVSVRTPAGIRVTHRVVAINDGVDETQLYLKGDANEVTDPQPYSASVASKVVWSHPTLGTVVATLTNRRAAFLTGVLAGAALALAVGARTRRRAPVRAPGP